MERSAIRGGPAAAPPSPDCATEDGRSIRATIAPSIPRELQSHFAIARGVVGPSLAHLDEQEEVHRLLDQLGDFLARFGADRPDRLAALAECDLTLALALDVDGLLDTH